MWCRLQLRHSLSCGLLRRTWVGEPPENSPSSDRCQISAHRCHGIGVHPPLMKFTAHADWILALHIYSYSLNMRTSLPSELGKLNIKIVYSNVLVEQMRLGQAKDVNLGQAALLCKSWWCQCDITTFCSNADNRQLSPTVCDQLNIWLSIADPLMVLKLIKCSRFAPLCPDMPNFCYIRLADNAGVLSVKAQDIIQYHTDVYLLINLLCVISLIPLQCHLLTKEKERARAADHCLRALLTTISGRLR